MWVFEGFLLAGCQVFVGFAQCYGSWPETGTNDLKEGSPINFYKSGSTRFEKIQ